MRASSFWSPALGVCVAALLSTSAASADKPANFSVMKEVKHDLSPPLRDIPPRLRQRGGQRVIPVGPIPLPRGTSLEEQDGARQFAPVPPSPVSTTDLVNFAGVGQGDHGYNVGSAPPDTNGAVGATQYVQWVNEHFAVFNKTNGSLLLGPLAGNTLWAGFGGSCESRNDGDPIAQYDKLAGRWVMAQPVFSAPYSFCVAVSQTSDATGAWYRYQFTILNPNTDFPDYPKLGVWPDGYYATFNIFRNSFVGAGLCALDRIKMLAGLAATDQCFLLSSSFGGVLPADFDGTLAPPLGSPNYLINFGKNSLNEWKFHVDWVNPSNTTLTGPIKINVARFSPVCGGGFCIPQKSTFQKLDSLADRMMYRLAYRKFGDHEALVANHSITSGNGRNGVAGVRWYEIRTPATPTLFQSGTFAPADGLHRWMGSIAMDKMGNIAVGYSLSGSQKYPSIAYTGRVPGDAAGTLEGEKITTSGGGSQTGGLERWGDYSAMSIDPTNDCTFYYTTEYLKTSGSFNWSTRINSFKFNSCN